MKTIYIVDDEKDLLNIIKTYLEKEGYAVKTFSDGNEAQKRIMDKVHVWLLDIMLGTDISGYDLIKSIKENNPAPVIFMSARDQELDRIMGLEMGSDDYITKPFSMREMVLRVNNVVKRVYSDYRQDIIMHNEYEFDIVNRAVKKDNETIQLTSKETDMIFLLLSHKGMSFTRNQLLNQIWEQDYFGSDRVVDDLVKRIRKKMPQINIETIYGHGYRLI